MRLGALLSPYRSPQVHHRPPRLRRKQHYQVLAGTKTGSDCLFENFQISESRKPWLNFLMKNGSIKFLLGTQIMRRRDYSIVLCDLITQDYFCL